MNFKEWLEDLKKLWIDKNIEAIVELFDERVEYYETPFEKVDNIEIVWKDIEEQEIKSLSYTVMGTTENCVVANYKLELPTRIVDMVYEIRLNGRNKCNYFKQWFMSEKK